jgi:two-component system response regulator YesN
MRLLIVEDEFYTRQGILEEIDLRGIGIDDCAQADDGVNALDVSRSFEPDIVLADVRMPRMDGVEMCFRLRKRYPCCQIVFMSGYADKEYLKAAIELKAVSYIEKPFRSSELLAVLKSAVDARRAAMESARREAELAALSQSGMPLLRSEIALRIVEHPIDEERIRRDLDAAGLAITGDSPLAVALVRSAARAFPAETAFKERFTAAIEGEASKTGLGCLTAFKGDDIVVIVFFAGPERRRLPGEREMEGLLARIFAAAPGIDLLAGVGDVHIGPRNAGASFQDASTALDGAFFHDAGHIGFHAAADAPPLACDENALDEFQACLDREEAEKAASLLGSVAAGMRGSGSSEAGRARRFLTRFLLRLIAFAERRGIDVFEAGESALTLSEEIERRGTLDGVLSLLQARLSLVIGRLAERKTEGRVAAEIKHIIHRNYGSPNLGIESIAAEVKLSEAYICRLFKEATGRTIHQYLIGYRLDRAKELLTDGKLPKMTEVAARTGFSDANYFAKVFRKTTGLAPSEYRERCLS